MKSKALDNIVEWKKLSNRIAEQFLYHYFDDLDPYDWWVSDEEGGILCYGDYFFSFGKKISKKISMNNKTL